LSVVFVEDVMGSTVTQEFCGKPGLWTWPALDLWCVSFMQWCFLIGCWQYLTSQINGDISCVLKLLDTKARLYFAFRLFSAFSAFSFFSACAAPGPPSWKRILFAGGCLASGSCPKSCRTGAQLYHDAGGPLKILSLELFMQRNIKH